MNNSQCILKISCLQNFRKVWHCYRVVWHCCSVLCRIRIMTGVCSFPSQCSLRSIHSQGKLLRHDQTRSQQVFGRIFTLKCYKTRPPINSERWSIFFCLCSYLLVQHEGCWLLGIPGSNPGTGINFSFSYLWELALCVELIADELSFAHNRLLKINPSETLI